MLVVSIGTEAGKLLRMAYAFLWPHGRQVADLETIIYQAARAAEPENGSKAGWDELAKYIANDTVQRMQLLVFAGLPCPRRTCLAFL